MLSKNSVRSFVAASIAATLTLSAVPTAHAAPLALDGSDRVAEQISAHPIRDAQDTHTTTISGVLRRAIADPAPQPSRPSPAGSDAAAEPDPTVWAQIESDTGESIAVDPLSPSLASASSGDEVTVTVEIDKAAQNDLTRHGLNLEHLQKAPQSTIDAALAEADPLTVTATRVTKKASTATKQNIKHRVYVVAIQDETQPGSFSVPQAVELTGRAATYWTDESLGAISSFTVTGQKSWTVNNSCVELDTDPFGFWERTAKQFPGVDIYAPGNHLAVFLPEGCSEDLGYTGLAMIGANISSGGPLAVMDDDLLTAAHEFGHNFSLGHANLEMILDGVAHELPYFAIYGPQSLATGAAPGALDIGFQRHLGLTSSSSVQTIASKSTTTTVLSPVSAESGLRGLTFTDPRTKAHFFVEYRSGTAKDRDAFYMTGWQPFTDVHYGPGVRVYRVVTDPISGGTALINVTSVRNNVFFPALSKNQTYTAPHSSFKITVGAVTATKAEVSVTFAQIKTKTQVSVSKATFGKSATVKVTTSGSPTPAGKVVIHDGKKKLKTLTLNKGKASYKLPANLTVGKHKIIATFHPATGFSASSASKTITVGQAQAKAKVVKVKGAKAGTVKKGTKAKITVRMTGISKQNPTGKVSVKVGKKTVSKAVKLKKVKGAWQATITTKKLPKGKVTIVYSGNKTFKKATYATTYVVK